MKNQQQRPKPSQAIRCECGGELRPTKFDAYDFSDYVGFKVTVSGAEGFRCNKCGGETVDGSLVNAVMNYTIVQVAKSPRLLNGAEARYLRHSLHATQEKLAKNMGIDRVTVADWERGAQQISPQHDFILRVFVMNWMVAENLITPSFMREVLGANSAAVRHLPPKKRTSISDTAAMVWAMVPNCEVRASA
jgi:DNA-binding transcriptional regulator YiaG